jgi:hypothetical protein
MVHAGLGFNLGNPLLTRNRRDFILELSHQRYKPHHHHHHYSWLVVELAW